MILRKKMARVRQSGRAFAAASLLVASLACGPKDEFQPDAAMMKPDAAVSHDSGAETDSGIGLFDCLDLPKQALTCQGGAVSGQLSRNQILSAGDVYLRLDDVAKDGFDLTKAEISILGGQCAELVRISPYEGSISDVELSDGTKISVAAAVASPDENNALLFVQKSDCVRECQAGDPIVQLLSAGESLELDSSMGRIEIRFDSLDSNSILDISLRRAETVLWSLYLAEGNTETADFWTTRFRITPWHMSAGRAELQVDIEECAVR